MSPNTSSSGTARAEPREWLSAYVFTRGSFRDLLVSEVAPFADAVLQRGLAERFFFIRYREGGEHVRLRFLGDPARLAPELERTFERYALQWVPYEPEVGRYGGPRAIAIAEECFDLSSRVALRILRETDDDGARGAAMLLHTALAHAFGMTRDEAVAFFHGVARSRLLGAEGMLQRFEQAAVGVNVPRAVWDALDGGDDFDLPWLQQWLDGIRGIAARLETVPVEPMPLHADFLQWVPARFSSRWMILSSYVHMTNNRLGVTWLDEPYVAARLSRMLAA